MIISSIKNKNKLIILLTSMIIIVGFVLLIVSINNKRYIDNIEFYLNGENVIEIEAETNWQDPLFIAKYNNQSISNNVIINSNLDINKSGTYEITYTIKKGLSSKILKRTIIVKEKNDGLTLTLNGDSMMYLSLGSLFVEPGYKAFNNNLDISDKVVVTSNLDTSVVGEYNIEYKIEEDIYTRKVIRIVRVINFDYQIDLENKDEFVKENSIIFSTIDDNFDYVLLPNGNKDFNNNVSYKINENGKYKLLIYNKLGFYEEKEFIVENIDKQIPTGTCVGKMYDNYTEVLVNATDDLGINGYEYIYGNNKSNIITKNEFKYSENINDVSVNIYDKVNNKVSIKCNMIDNSTKTPSSYKSYTFIDSDTSAKMNYWLYIPDNLTKRHSMPLLVYLHGDGSRGTNINLVNNYAFPKFIRDGQSFPFMMLAGQISNETNWSSENTFKTLMKLVNSVVSNYNVNPRKIMIAGGSSGASGAYKMAAYYPDYFSCTIIGSGVYYSVFRDYAQNLTRTPMWIFHGTKDGIDYNSVKSFADYINSLGGNVHFKGIEGAGHNVTETIDGFNDPELINWMISQERN